MKLEKFIERTREDFENFMYRRISTQSNGKGLEKILEGGKRLRPVLCILSFRICGGTDEEYKDALDAATAIELGHCASLCHDDIIDEDLYRRNSPTLWIEEGIPKTLLLGHQAISFGLDILMSHGVNTAKTFLEAWRESLRGSFEELNIRRCQEVARSTYLKINREKSASIFSAAAKIGAQVARSSEELVKTLGKYGMEVGEAYQQADDLSELPGNESKELSSMFGRVVSSGNPVSPKEFIKGKMEEAIKKAEKSCRAEWVPENEFKPLLSKVPTHFVQQILEKDKKQALGENLEEV